MAKEITRPPLREAPSLARIAHDFPVVAEALNSRDKMINELYILLAQKNEIAVHDPLTNIFNRNGYQEMMQRLLGETSRSNYEIGDSKTIAIIHVDLDHFKQVNDTYGHHTGDDILKAAADQMKKQFRRGGDIIARQGGDEFIISFAGKEADVMAEAIAMAEALRVAVRKKCRINQNGDNITVGFFGKPVVSTSIGIALMTPDEEIAETLKRADFGTYASKARGRDCVCAVNKDGDIIHETRPMPRNEPTTSREPQALIA